MKKASILFAIMVSVIFSAFSFCAQAQERYSETEMALLRAHGLLGDKVSASDGFVGKPTIHNLRGYYSLSWSGMEDGDKYDPVWTAVASAVFPGLGQTICGKSVRGLLFLLGTAAPVTAAVLTYKKPYTNGLGFEERDITHTVLLAGAAAIMWIWNVVDAAEVAVLVNKYNRDLEGWREAAVSMVPYVSLNPTGVAVEPSVGLSLVLNF